MNGWEAFAAAPVWFIVWTLAAGFSAGGLLRGLAVLVTAVRGR